MSRVKIGSASARVGCTTVVGNERGGAGPNGEVARLITETLGGAKHVPAAVKVEQRGVRASIGRMAPPAGNASDNARRGLAVGRRHAVLLRLERLARACSTYLPFWTDMA